MATVYLGLGSNLGEKDTYLRNAVTKIEEQIGRVTSLSALYVTEAWGYISQNSYLNAVCCVESTLQPLALLQATQSIEIEMGRLTKTTQGQYNDRVIDIDILLYNNLILDMPQLTVPHPLIAERNFVLAPLAEIAPDVVHPIYKASIKELLDKLNVSLQESL